jgi:3-oxoacyl-[acyl-carrier protein] reductase
MLLSNKTAVVYGAAGPVGSAVARAFATEGARLFLAGRTAATLTTVADRIRADGGGAEIAEVDATDQDAVDRHVRTVVDTTGRVDIAFDAIANDDVQGASLMTMPYDDFLRPVIKSVTAFHHIATAVAPYMSSRGGGVVLAMAGGREAIPNLGGSHVAWSALAGLSRQLAAELGPSGIRVAWLLSPGSDSVTDAPATAPPDAFESALLRRRPSYDDVARAATFLASDWASSMTATELNLTAGVVVD